MLKQEVCRLCLSEENLMCVFDKRLEKTDHMKEVILITTGVEIHSKDVISQKICTKCGQDALKMFQFRQQSLKNDRYLKAQCRELLKHTDLKIPNTSVTIKTERIDKEEIKQEPPRKPPYKVHPTMHALSRKYPQMQFPTTCWLYNIDPCISMEMDTVENYFKNKKLNMRKHVQVALKASNGVISKKTSAITKSLVKMTENSTKNIPIDCVAQSTSTAVSEAVGNAEVADKISPINIKMNQSGYAIVKTLTESIDQCEVQNVCESMISSKSLINGCPESQSSINESKKRRLTDNDFLSEPETKKVLCANPSNIKISSPAFKCNICSSVEFSAEHLLEKHQIEHSRCKFCRMQFRSVGMKQQHINNTSCLVEEALNNLLDVEVERIELNMNVRLHHQEAFTNFPPLSGLEKLTSASKSSKTGESIEIISDDEVTSVSTENSVSTKPVCSNDSTCTTSTLAKTLHENPTVALVIRPDVRMKNDIVLDSLKAQTADIEVVKELLTKFKKLQSATNEATQTELPTTDSIRIKKGHLTAELANLKQTLHSYQIPVKIRKGPINALYNYQRIPSRPKILRLWNDLSPIDVKIENNPVSEHVIVDITETHSNSITNGAQRKPPTISIQTESLISTPECFTVLQAEPHTSISTYSSFKTKIRNRKKSLDSPHSNSNSNEIFPVQAASSGGDIPIRRHSPNSFGTGPTIPHINNNSLAINSVQAPSSTPNAPSWQNSFGMNQTTSQNNPYIDEARRKSPVQNTSVLNASWNSLNTQTEAMDCSTKTSQELTNNVIDVFNNCSKTVESSTINLRSPNGVIYSKNQQSCPPINKASKPKKKKIQRDQNMRHVPATTHSRTNDQSYYGNNAPILKQVDNNLFIKPPPPYPTGSTRENQTTRSYISSYANTKNVPRAAETPQSGGFFNAFHQYVSQLQEYRHFQPMDSTSGTYCPNVPMNNVVHHGNTGHFTAATSLGNSLENRPMLQVPEPFGYTSSSFSHYSMASNYDNASVTIDTVNQNYNVNNRQLPNSPCTDSSTLAACDTLTDSVRPSDKSKHFASGMIRVRNVSELT